MPHKIHFSQPLRAVRLRNGSESLVSAADLDDMLRARFQAGVEAGQKTLAEQLVQQRAQLLEIQNGVLRSLQQALPGVIADCEQSLVLLAMEAAKRIVGDLPITPAAVEGTVRQALSELRETSEYQVFLHPEDLSLLQAVQSGVLPAANDTKVQFTPDPSVSRGGCIVRTRHGSIEALREKMFEKLERAVLC